MPLRESPTHVPQCRVCRHGVRSSWWVSCRVVVVGWSLVGWSGFFRYSLWKSYPFLSKLNPIAIDYQFQLSTNCDKFRQLSTTPKKSKLRQSRSPKCDTFRQIQFSISFDKLRDILFFSGVHYIICRLFTKYS